MKESDRVRHTMGSSPDRRLVEACSNEHLIEHIKVANPKRGPCGSSTGMLHHGAEQQAERLELREVRLHGKPGPATYPENPEMSSTA